MLATGLTFASEGAVVSSEATVMVEPSRVPPGVCVSEVRSKRGERACR